MDCVERLAASGPVTLSTQNRTTCLVMARYHVDCLTRHRRLDEALAAVERARRLNDSVFGPDKVSLPSATSHTQQSRDRAADLHASFVSQLHIDRATVHDAAGRYADSVAEWDSAISGHRCYGNEKMVGRFLALAGAGDYERAAAAAGAIDAGKLDRDHRYELGRAYCRCSRGPWPADRRDELLSSALECLRVARERGYGEYPDELERVRTDPEWEPLRARTEFAALAR
jgi:hypothetical protein